MTLKLKILGRAEGDAQGIFDYIQERSPRGAAEWWLAFETAAQSASEGVIDYPLAPENDSVNYELKQVTFKTRAGRRYRFVFTIVGDELRILRARGPGQPKLQSDELD